MKTRYESTSLRARSLAAAAAVATVIALFDFVAGLGAARADALTTLRAAPPVMTMASAKASRDAPTNSVQ